MAKIGLNNFRWAKLTEASDGTPSYDGAKKPAKAISCSVNITNNNASLYADDALAESDTSFQNGTVAMGIDDEDLETTAGMLGHSYSDGRIVRSASDIAPYIGIGRVVKKMVNNTIKYKAELLYKVKMSEPSQEDNTQGETLAFNTSTLNGTIATLVNGKWSEAKTFDTQTAAISYIEGLLAATPST